MGNVNLHSPPTPGQLKGMMIAREISATPSLIGSMYIMQDVIRSPGRRRDTGTRILFGMSSMDFLYALFSLSNSWPAPKGTPWTPAAIGTWQTCEVFGFIGQASKTSSVLYNGSLALYYLLTIRYNWRDWRVKRLEPWLHAVPLLFGWVTALVALQLELYNPVPMACSIRAYPLNCGASGKRPCERGENAEYYQMAFFYVPMWTCFFFLVAVMSSIYRKMARLQAANQRWGSINISNDSSTIGGASSTRNNNMRRSINAKRQFAIQALLYCSAYGVTWIFGMIKLIIEKTSPTTGKIPLVFLHIIMASLQGFLNACIYIRPRYLKSRADQQRRNRRRLILPQLRYDAQTPPNEQHHPSSSSKRQLSSPSNSRVAALVHAISLNASSEFGAASEFGEKIRDDEEDEGSPAVPSLSSSSSSEDDDDERCPPANIVEEVCPKKSSSPLESLPGDSSSVVSA